MDNATRDPASGSCPVCGCEPGTSAGKYCSSRCKHRASNRRRSGLPVADGTPQAADCPVCGSTLAGRKHGTRYCSEPCMQRARWRRKRGQQIADDRGTKGCAHCGGDIKIAPHRQNARFCSRRCSYNFNSALYALRRRPVLLRRCPVCGDDIPAADNLRKKYCSASCRGRRTRSADVVFRYVNARRARLAGASARPLPKRVLRRLRTAPCTYCQGPGGTVDHVIPLSRGGQHAEGNLVPACRSCNSSKSDKLLIEWIISRPRPA